VTLEQVAVWMLWFIALYPPVTAAFWIAGGLVFRLFDERAEVDVAPPGGWPPVTVLIPAYNEQEVIGSCVRAALEVDYPELEVIVLDDGSTDGTVSAAETAIGGDPRAEVLNDGVNRGKAERLNHGLRRARHELVIECDADTHMHPQAPKFLVARMLRSSLNAAVAGSPHVTNRTNLLCAMQVLETASIIGLIRRTQALRGRVGTVAGVLALLHRERVLAVGGYRGQMATEDIDLTWRLLMAGWHTTFEPEALIGMQVPDGLSSLWAQRCRWARGQGEVLHEHLGRVVRWRQRGMWLIALESVLSLVWVVAWALALTLAAIDLFAPGWHTIFGFALAWGVAIAVVCSVQLAFALSIDSRYDRRALRAFLLGPLYPLFFWAISALAAIRAELVALVKGPGERGVVWDIARDRVDTTTPTG
jgi:biofilm PGA synthesis N-glycosyltransferase PgaC